MRRSRKRVAQVLAVGVVVVGAPVMQGAGTAGASSPRRAVGSAARLPLGARFGPALPAARRLRLTIALEPRDPAALRALATAVSTPGARRYGRYLTVPQFAQRFGATRSQLAAVSAAMRAGELHVAAPTANHLTIAVSGTVARVQRAFSVTEARVRLPGGRAAFANDRAPRLAGRIAGSVQAILGLDDLARPQPLGLARPRAGARRTPAARAHAVGGGPAPCADAASVSANIGGYTADEIAGAYGVGSYYPSDEGAGQTVALVEFQADDPTDIATYQQCYGTSAPVTSVDVDGGPGPFSGSDDEPALDVEQVIGLAPRANVLVYQAPGNDSQAAVLDAIASQDVAKVVSSSWGGVRGTDGPPGHQRRERGAGGDGRAGPVVLQLLGRQRLDDVLPAQRRRYQPQRQRPEQPALRHLSRRDIPGQSGRDQFANAGSTSFAWMVVTPGRPRLSTAPRLSALGRRRPRLSGTVTAGTFAPALKSVAIRLPGVLRAARAPRSLAKGIAVKAGARRVAFSATLRGGALTITFKAAVTGASLTVAGPAITISKANAAKIRRHKLKRLTISLKATDVDRTPTSFRVTVTKLS